MSVAESTIHSWQKGLRRGETFCLVDYMDAQDVVNVHPGFTIVASNVIQIPVDKDVYRIDLTENRPR